MDSLGVCLNFIDSGGSISKTLVHGRPNFVAELLGMGAVPDVRICKNLCLLV